MADAEADVKQLMNNVVALLTPLFPNPAPKATYTPGGVWKIDIAVTSGTRHVSDAEVEYTQLGQGKVKFVVVDGAAVPMKGKPLPSGWAWTSNGDMEGYAALGHILTPPKASVGRSGLVSTVTFLGTN
jgi:hypothetical protein